MTHICAIGFDLDNTLYKVSEPINIQIRAQACKYAAELLKRDYAKTVADFTEQYALTQSASTSLQNIGIQSSALAKELVQRALEEANVAKYIEPNKKLADMLLRLKNNYHLFLITGSRHSIAQGKLDALQIPGNVFEMAIYAESKYRREDGSAFAYVHGKLAAPYKNTIFVGDRETVDILPAKKKGLKTIIVNNKSLHADFFLTDICELEDIVAQIESQN